MYFYSISYHSRLYTAYNQFSNLA
uniref:Uncharacterized protein n=1 Tax=Anguilla anguilla TaxID=7936 RepID=A0A0E9XLT9_ANGAN